MRGEVVRLYLTNTANTRVFNLAIPGAQVKLVGADSGHYEHEELVDEVLIAPSERVVLDVHFPAAGELTLDHTTPERTYTLATIAVEDTPADPDLSDGFHTRRTNSDMAARIGGCLVERPEAVGLPPEGHVVLLPAIAHRGNPAHPTGTALCARFVQAAQYQGLQDHGLQSRPERTK